MNTVYRVAGMTCAGCARAVARAITRRAPAAIVSVDFEKGRVTVAGEAASSLVSEAVAEAGFTFGGLAVPAG